MYDDKYEFNAEDFLAKDIELFSSAPVAPRPSKLPLTELDWKTFEQLCVRLVMKDSGEFADQVHLWGVQGDDQAGIDIIAPKKVQDDLQMWSYQCKDYKYFAPSLFEQAIVDLQFEADHYVFFLASEAQASLRNIEKNHDNITLLDQNDISRKLEGHPDIVGKFFHEAWIEEFCTVSIDDLDKAIYSVSGTVFAYNAGDPISGARLMIAASKTRNISSSEIGDFQCSFDTTSENVLIVCTYRNPENDKSYSRVEEFSWEDAVTRRLPIRLIPDKNVKARLLWKRTQKPIGLATINVEVGGHILRSVDANLDGSFIVDAPYNKSKLRIQVNGAKQSDYLIDIAQFHESDEFETIYIAQECNVIPSHYSYIVETICDELEIPLGEIIPENDRDITATFLDYQFAISKFPITCLDYSVFLQYQDNVMNLLPQNWTSLFPPSNKLKHPITGITWYQANRFCGWLSEKTNKLFRLPTQSEWEIAARGSQMWEYPWGNSSSIEDIQLRCNIQNSMTSDVDKYVLGKSPFGIWDMLGNASEWTCSRMDEETIVDCTDATQILQDNLVIVKGGSYFSSHNTISCTSTEKFVAGMPNIFTGFRVVHIPS